MLRCRVVWTVKRCCPAAPVSSPPQMVKVQKALVLQKYARAWLARRRFQTMRRLVINVQLSFRVQNLRKKIEDQVRPGATVAEEVERVDW